MKVIGTGLPRTGTSSLQEALNELGFGPCYHMVELLKRPEQLPVWCAAVKGEKVDWVAFFDGWESCVDAPGCCVWRELVTALPEALVLHSVLPPERWYESMYNTIYSSFVIKPMYPAWLQLMVPKAKRMTDMANSRIWQGMFDERFSDREYAISVYNKHTEEVSTVTMIRCKLPDAEVRLTAT
eukprot:3497-Heterococcus_DN1.PRE.2